MLCYVFLNINLRDQPKASSINKTWSAYQKHYQTCTTKKINDLSNRGPDHWSQSPHVYTTAVLIHITSQNSEHYALNLIQNVHKW